MTTVTSFPLQTVSGAGQLPATVTNDNAAAGKLGEFITQPLLVGAAVSLVTATAKTVTSIPLTAGDWDVHGIAVFVTAGSTTISQLVAALNTTTNAFPALPGVDGYVFNNSTYTTGSNNSFGTGVARFSLAAPTNVYLVVQAVFAVSTMTAYGTLSARRVR